MFRKLGVDVCYVRTIKNQDGENHPWFHFGLVARGHFMIDGVTYPLTVLDWRGDKETYVTDGNDAQMFWSLAHFNENCDTLHFWGRVADL
jgi:hypothetical protein